MSGFDTLPAGSSDTVQKFNLHISDEKISNMKQLIKQAPIGPVTFDNQAEDGKHGVSRSWLINAKRQWEETFDWRAEEALINSLPQYTATVTDDDGSTFNVHFMALFSLKKDAVPIGLYHGWPGSFLEFMGLLDVMKKRYTPETLPYHLIVPSLVGYTLSDGPPTDKIWTTADTTRIMHKLMLLLGFKAYAAQGGDVGSMVSRAMGLTYDECKAVHLNLNFSGLPEDAEKLEVTPEEAEALQRAAKWQKTGMAYALEHGTRPNTISLALSTSPVALLAWIGEKFLDWTDEDPPLVEILRSISLYWLTDTFPRCIYPYKELVDQVTDIQQGSSKVPAEKPKDYIEKPFGFSWFPHELAPSPISWVGKTGNLVWYRRHKKGGHFAAMERPEEMATDIEDFIKQVWVK